MISKKMKQVACCRCWDRFRINICEGLGQKWIGQKETSIRLSQATLGLKAPTGREVPSLVTEGSLVGGGRHKVGDSRAEWHRTWHRSSSYGPHSPQMISKISSEGQGKAIATALLPPSCERGSQGTTQLLPSKAPPFPAKVTQHSQATSKNPAKLWESCLGLGPVLIKSSFISPRFPLEKHC